MNRGRSREAKDFDGERIRRNSSDRRARRPRRPASRRRCWLNGAPPRTGCTPWSWSSPRATNGSCAWSARPPWSCSWPAATWRRWSKRPPGWPIGCAAWPTETGLGDAPRLRPHRRRRLPHALPPAARRKRTASSGYAGSRPRSPPVRRGSSLEQESPPTTWPPLPSTTLEMHLASGRALEQTINMDDATGAARFALAEVALDPATGERRPGEVRRGGVRRPDRQWRAAIDRARRQIEFGH